MKKLMYIFLALPILTGCKEKKSTGAMGGVPTPEISVTKPIVENITLTKDYPGYLTTEKTVNLVARVNGTLQSTSYVAGGREVSVLAVEEGGPEEGCLECPEEE